MDRACAWESRGGALVGRSPRPTTARAVLALAFTGVVLLVSGALVGVHAVEVASTGGWSDRVCRTGSARGCAPAWLSLAFGVFLLAAGLALGANAVRERGGREDAVALEEDDLRVRPRGSTESDWIRLRWVDVADVVADGPRLAVLLRDGVPDFAGRAALDDLLCGDARRDAAVLRHFLNADRECVGGAPARDAANRISAANDTP